jgi:hypothetical protein
LRHVLLQLFFTSAQTTSSRWRQQANYGSFAFGSGFAVNGCLNARHDSAAANRTVAKGGLSLIGQLCSEQSVDASMRLAIGRHFPGLHGSEPHSPDQANAG